MLKNLAPLFVSVLLVAANGFGAESDSPLTFERDIRPILHEYCFDCHGAVEEMKGKLDHPFAHITAVFERHDQGQLALRKIRFKRGFAHSHTTYLEPVQPVGAVVEHQDATRVAETYVGERLGRLIWIGKHRTARPKQAGHLVVES